MDDISNCSYSVFINLIEVKILIAFFCCFVCNCSRPDLVSRFITSIFTTGMLKSISHPPSPNKTVTRDVHPCLKCIRI